jgi:AcrR family transcriptional regulator
VPRISAASVPEHVAQQRAAVFEAAMELFVTEGYGQVSMGDIASKVGLARNSLYRYFPDKAHILLEWFRDELPRQAAHSAEILGADGPPTERISRWAVAELLGGLVLAAGRCEPDGPDPMARTRMLDAIESLVTP